MILGKLVDGSGGRFSWLIDGSKKRKQRPESGSNGNKPGGEAKAAAAKWRRSNGEVEAAAGKRKQRLIRCREVETAAKKRLQRRKTRWRSGSRER
jgi:hypothetical protein